MLEPEPWLQGTVIANAVSTWRGRLAATERKAFAVEEGIQQAAASSAGRVMLMSPLKTPSAGSLR